MVLNVNVGVVICVPLGLVHVSDELSIFGCVIADNISVLPAHIWSALA